MGRVLAVPIIWLLLDSGSGCRCNSRLARLSRMRSRVWAAASRVILIRHGICVEFLRRDGKECVQRVTRVGRSIKESR